MGDTAFLRCLALLLIGLQLSGLIVWSWWAVLAPLWLPIAAQGLIAFCVGLVNGYRTARRKS